MRKVISLFQRNYEGDRQVRDELVPGAEWVAAGEGVATVKWDGTACMWKGGRLWRRYDAKRGKRPPAGFEPAQEPDAITGHHPGWIPCAEENPADRWHLAALTNTRELLEEGATYEAVGPHHQGNPYRFAVDLLVRHGGEVLHTAPRTFVALLDFFRDRPRLEGIVWHHPDGRMVKTKARDFGLRWPPAGATP